MILELASLLVVGVVGTFAIGYMTPKYVIWGSSATLAIALCFWVLPGPEFVATDVLRGMTPLIIDFFFIYPKAVSMSAANMGAQHGLIGSLVTIGFGILFLPPYLLGIWLGLTTWPELLLFKVFL